MEQEDLRTSYVLAWVSAQDKLEFDRHYPDGTRTRPGFGPGGLPPAQRSHLRRLDP